MRTYASALQNKLGLLRQAFLPLGRKVAYIGYTGRRNFGDELLLDTYRRIAGRPVVPVLDTFSFQKRLPTDCVLGGGTVIGGTLYLRAFKRLRSRPSRVFCAGVIPGPIGEDWKYVLEACNIYTRSQRSRDRIRELGLEATALVDPAIFCGQLRSRNQDPRYASSLLLAPHGAHPYTEAHTRILAELTPTEKANLAVFASSPEDYRLCKHIYERHGGRLIKGWRSIDDSLAAIANTGFVVSTRLHPAICAASYGTPFRMLAYDEKHLEFAESITSEWVIIDPSAPIGPIFDDLRTQIRSPLPGVRRWHDSFDEFCIRFI